MDFLDNYYCSNRKDFPCNRKSINLHQDLVKKDIFFGNINHLNKKRVIPKKDYKNWFDYSYDLHFSTHDWLAYIPIQIIKQNRNLINRWDSLSRGKFWTDDRIKLFLYATAGPDYYDDINYRGTECPFSKYTHYFRLEEGKRMSYRLSPDYITTTFSVLKRYYVRDAYLCCYLLEEKLFATLAQDNINLSIFYMGLIAHYIGDCACFTHISDFFTDKDFNLTSLDPTTRFKEINKNYREMVSERTDDRNQLYKFFQIEVSKSKIYESVNAHRAVFRTAFNTYYDSNIYGNQGKFNASYMLNNYEKVIQDKWDDFQEGWQKNHVKNDAYFYLLRVQESLQVAVQSILYFLNNIIQKLYIG